MKPIWMKELLRDAEGEGSGGAAQGVDPQPPAPAEGDKLSALEQRLSRISQSVEGMTASQKQQQAMAAITGKTTELENAKREAQDAVAAAEAKLAQAYDDGEGLEIAKAQRLLSESVAKVERRDADLSNWKEQVKAAERKTQAQPQGGADLDDSNLKSWKTKHSDWYGVDAALTKASHEIDRQIRDAGVLSVGSKEYFDAIDRSLSQKFPDRFGGTPQTTTGGQQMQQNTADKGRINKTIADGYRRMGINIDDPKVAERMVKNRQIAVQKGILPEQPVQGSIVTR